MPSGGAYAMEPARRRLYRQSSTHFNPFYTIRYESKRSTSVLNSRDRPYLHFSRLSKPNKNPKRVMEAAERRSKRPVGL